MSREWNDEQVGLLKDLWNDGFSARQIGARVGKTKNAVIGKARREGLQPKRPAYPRGAAERKPRVRKIKLKPAKVLVIEPVAEPPVEGGVPIWDLKDHHCRSIVGHGADGLARYCGAGTVVRVRTQRDGRVTHETASWCAAHAAIYFSPRT